MSDVKRVIKFRAWDGEIMLLPDMYDWEDVHIQLDGVIQGVKRIGFYQETSIVSKDSFTLMQFTGLHDKNGKEIYEGDVLKTISTKTHVIETYQSGFWKGQTKKSRQIEVENNVVVEWGRYGFEFKTLNPAHHGFNVPSFEVIGNIYESLELLKS